MLSLDMLTCKSPIEQATGIFIFVDIKSLKLSFCMNDQPASIPPILLGSSLLPDHYLNKISWEILSKVAPHVGQYELY